MVDWKSHIRSRVSALGLPPAREREIVEELAQHLEDRWRELMATGATPDDAAHKARTEFDGARLEARLGTLRQAHWHEPPPPGPSRAVTLDAILIDLRHAVRALRATPSFTIGALLVIALGTGATTAIFSVVDAVALRPLPFPDPDGIVALGMRADAATGGRGGPQAGPRPMPGMPGAKPPDPDTLMNVRVQDYLGWLDRQQAFEPMAAINDMGDAVVQPPNGEPELVKGQRVTASFFDVLRVRPALGTTFTPGNELAGGNHVVLVSHGFWQRHLGADPSAVGRALTIAEESYTIVGVMPPGFAYPPGSLQPTDLWTPWVAEAQARAGGERGARALGGSLQIIARLKADVSLEHARAQMIEVAAAIGADNPTANAGRTIGIRPLRDHLVGTSTRSWMLMLLAAVAIVLLIACANVANLWLARATVLQRDAAVRAALGASRARLAQRALIESFVVSVAGTVVGVGLAWFCVRVLAAALPENVVRIGAIGIDARVLAVAGLAAVATGLVSGLGPALHGSNPALSSMLNESGRGGGSGRGRRHARAVLVIAEVALAVVLLVGAALFIGSFINVLRIDPGFRVEGVLAAQVVQPPVSGSAVDVRPVLVEIVERARQLPGVVEAAAAAPGIPFRINLRIGGLQAPGQPLDYNKTVSVKYVTAGYHRTLAIPLRSGRYFTDGDRDGAEAVVILSDAAARMFFGDDDPLGRVVINVGERERRVVGVVANARQASLEVSPHPEIYLPMMQARGESYGFVLVKRSGDPNNALPALRAIVGQLLPGVPLRQVARLEDLMAAQTAERRLSMLMFGLFGFLGLVISAVGIFAVIAYLVSQQTREIGIRMALGATRSRVVAGVFGHVGRLVAAGLIVGGLVAWSVSNAAGRFLFGLDPRDPRAYAVAMITLLMAAFVATLLPARRAASVEPTKALQQE